MSATAFEPKKKNPWRSVGAFDLATFTVGAKSVNTINVAVQLKNARGMNIGERVICDCFISDAATGAGITTTPMTSAIAIGTNGNLIVIDTTGILFTVESDASGRFDVNLIQTATPQTFYLVLVLPDKSILVSGAITF